MQNDNCIFLSYANVSAEESAIQKQLLKFVESFNAGDIVAVTNLYTQDVKWLNPGADGAHGKEGICQIFMFCKTRRNTKMYHLLV